MEVSEGQNNTDVWSGLSAETGGRGHCVTVNTRAELVRNRCDTHTRYTHSPYLQCNLIFFSMRGGGGKVGHCCVQDCAIRC